MEIYLSCIFAMMGLSKLANQVAKTFLSEISFHWPAIKKGRDYMQISTQNKNNSENEN